MKKTVLVLMGLLVGISLIFAISIRTNRNRQSNIKFFGSLNNKLKIKSTTTLEGNFELKNMIFDLNATDIQLTGNDNQVYKLKIEYYEYSKGDVEFFFNEENFKFKSKTEKGVFIKSLIGTIPNYVKLKIDNGTGSISLKNYIGDSIVINNGTGSINVENTNGKSLDIDNGTGKIFITSGKFEKFLSIDNGTGNIIINDEIFNADVVIDNGVGNVSIDGLISASVSVDNGTGNIKISNSKIAEVQANTGIGNVVFKNNNFNTKDFNTGIGKILDENNEKLSY